MEPGDGKMFLIVESDPTVARDIEESLHAFDPLATVRLAATSSDTHALLPDLDRLTAAFLHLPSAELRTAAIPRAVEERGGGVVVIDARPSELDGDEAQGWVYLGRPFGAGAVARALERLGIDGA